MIPKVISAIVSAAILSAVLGTLPCGATAAKKQTKGLQAPASSSSSVASDLNSPSMNFSGVKPMIDNQHPDLIAPKKDKNQFFDQTIR